MASWLAPIFGVVIIGVIIELVSKNSPTGKFVRAIYGFFVLFVIIEPLPKLFGGGFDFGAALDVNAGLLEDINNSPLARQLQIESILTELGYADTIVSVSDGTVFVNTGRNLSEADIIKIKQAIGEGESYIS